MNYHFKTLLHNLSVAIDIPGLDDPRLDFTPSPRYFPLIARQDKVSDASQWVWRNTAFLGRDALIPLKLRQQTIQVSIGYVEWSDTVSYVATRTHRSIRRRSPLFLANAVIETVSDQQIIRLISAPSINSSLLSWLDKYGITAEIDPTAAILDAFHTNNEKLNHQAFNDVHIGLSLSPAAQLALTLNPDRNPAILTSYGAALLAGEKTEPQPKHSFNDRLIAYIPLDAEQRRAVLAALRGDNFVLIGPPGCGKTQTIAATVINLLAQHPNLKIGVASPVEAALDSLRRLIDNDTVDYRQYHLTKYNAPDDLDLLIVDEASRTTTAEIFPFVARARQVIIVGDPYQSLPPAAAPRLDPEDISLIHRALENPNFTQYDLRNHYRSVHPDLLAFSNNLIYDGRLRVVPAPQRERDDGLCLHYAPAINAESGHYSTTNIHEVKVLASELVSHALNMASRGISRSRMAVGWAPAHARLLEKAIKAELKTHNADESLLSPVNGEPFIVYSASDVQGQERDETWISFGHGIDPARGRLASARQPTTDMSVGALQKMNVLATRSRLATRLYHSVTPADIFQGQPTDEILALFAMMNVETIDAHTRYEIDPDHYANNTARRRAKGDPSLPNPEAVNLACVFGVRDRDDPPDTWRYGLFRKRPEWSDDEYYATRDMLRAKNWQLVDL